MRLVYSFIQPNATRMGIRRCSKLCQVGYTQHYLCRQPHEKIATPGGFLTTTWVDATNIKTNPNEKTPLVGVR